MGTPAVVKEFEMQTFMGKMANGGAMASLFRVKFTAAPFGAAASASSPLQSSGPYRCKTTSFPASTITTAEVAYMGRTVTIPGNREAQQITTEFYNDEAHGLRGDVLKWMDNINGHATNKRKDGSLTYGSYRGEMTIDQMGKDDPNNSSTSNIKNSVTIYNCWPSEVGEISLDWETNEIQTFEVTWEFSHWTQTAGGIGAKA